MNFRAMKSWLVASVLVLAVLAAACSSSGLVAPRAAATSPSHPQGISTKEEAFHDAMRKLWEDHITWTRMFIVDFAAGSPETEATTGRLLRNQVDIGNAIKPYYGEEAGSKLADLLKQHILTAADLLAAAKAGNQAKVDEASKRWYANANDIAAFLHGANPANWPLSDLQSMMKSHLDLTLQEAVAHLKGQWPADIAAYDKVHDEILQMADMLSNGIIKQFPKDF